MKIDHIAIWSRNLEGLKQFYGEFFQGEAGTKYYNPKTGLQTYFLRFASGTRMEIMQKPYVIMKDNQLANLEIGFVHIAFSVGSKVEVDELTAKIRERGFPVLSEPRTTGDGYYESVVLDPDGNRIEITA